ncbi:uncharacterized protein LOC135083089 [Ostrinia nubilalis]|uniref:uncharacterized protein LOC135083089 n=1 Tax=Ostrinia nubilalis TaxID=29057 RepID=UPI0030825AA3
MPMARWRFIESAAREMVSAVTELVWKGRCTQHPRVLNDCNWCRCNRKHEYTCDARNCSEVDVFGHFNDAIREMNVGMEGHGSWRSTQLACEPGVQYRRKGLLCVCTEDGTWPNPVCRDIFRILHSVEMTDETEAAGQKCSATKLYLVGCNVCLCPSTQRLDPEYCTRKICSENDPILQDNRQKDNFESDDQAIEIYAECQSDYKYKLGCKTCSCLRNNRLHCGNCTNENKSVQTFCSHIKPGQTFSRDCNLCYCDKKGFAYCTSKKCLEGKVKLFTQDIANKTEVESYDSFNEENCIPGRNYRQGCNQCYCYVENGTKLFGCTLKNCARSANPVTTMHLDCVDGTVYELNCLICHCIEEHGVKTQLCQVNPKCTDQNAVRESRSNDLDSLHGYCEPLHVYKKDCNTCHCLSDGKTVRCTSYVCGKSSLEPVAVDIVPVTQKGRACPKGLSYKIDCNYCFCLSNGNAICTTADCTGKKRSKKN